MKFIDITDLFQDKINELTEEMYGDDECKPKYTLSIMGYDEDAKFILSIDHLGVKFSNIIFPKKGIVYNNGFDLYEEMKQLYNRIM
ncbi:MAG: hypothetical protein E6356_13825 [Terrisporobacter othiniensis]|nr:hypothetical protein [Terrisporobacter othiniensis]